MWTNKQGRAVRAVVAGAIAAFALMMAMPKQAGAAPLYVRVCDYFGAGFFLPGTDTCADPSQIVANQFALSRLSTQAATGTAMAASLVNPWLPDGTNYAISLHWAGFDGQNALGFVGLRRIVGNLSLSAGLSVGLDHGSLTTFSSREATEFGVATPSQSWSNLIWLGRVGLEYSW